MRESSALTNGELFIMAKEINMQTSETEIKAIAKAVKASLTRDGHSVPHTAVLKALSSALNKRDWQTLKASLSSEKVTVSATLTDKSVFKSYDNKTQFWVRLAYFSGNPLKVLPADSVTANQKAREAVGLTKPGVLNWCGWNVPADLSYANSVVDVGDFEVNTAGATGLLTLRYLHGAVSLEVGYTASSGWYVSSKGAADFFEQLEHAVTEDRILGALDATAVLNLDGPEVRAEFYTDDRVFTKNFDARLALMGYSDKNLEAIIWTGYGGDTSTDDLVQPLIALDSDLEEAFDYLNAVNIGNRDIGYEVKVDPEQFLRWMDACHQPLLARILCERQGVTLMQSQQEEILGRWDWVDDRGNGSESSFETESEAILDAYLRLDLLSAEIADN